MTTLRFLSLQVTAKNDFRIFKNLSILDGLRYKIMINPEFEMICALRDLNLSAEFLTEKKGLIIVDYSCIKITTTQIQISRQI